MNRTRLQNSDGEYIWQLYEGTLLRKVAPIGEADVKALVASTLWGVEMSQGRMPKIRR